MKILCIDTSSTLCGVAILEDYKLLTKIELNNGLTHSETLMPSIQKLFSDSNITLNDIDLIVVDIGPGSFTGLRIGIATAKAFSDSLNIPCVGISSLEVLAYNAKKDGTICSLIDCKNNNSYFAVYEKKNNSFQPLIEPQFSSNTEIIKILNSEISETITKNIQFVGNNIFDNSANAIKPNKNSVPSDSTSSYLNIENLGIAGLNKFKKNKSGEEILPLYIKKPQAQILLENYDPKHN